MSDQHRRDAFVLQAVRWAMSAAARNAHAELKRRLNLLATIAATAPLVGLFGTVLGIIAADRGCGTEMWLCYTATLNGLSQALLSTALGLLVAVPAVWAYNYFSDRLQIFDLETASASLELVTHLSVTFGRRGLNY